MWHRTHPAVLGLQIGPPPAAALPQQDPCIIDEYSGEDHEIQFAMQKPTRGMPYPIIGYPKMPVDTARGMVVTHSTKMTLSMNIAKR